MKGRAASSGSEFDAQRSRELEAREQHQVALAEIDVTLFVMLLTTQRNRAEIRDLKRRIQLQQEEIDESQRKLTIIKHGFALMSD